MLTEKESYNAKYRKINYFGIREWLYRPYISSLVSISGLKAGSKVLDVGCGQGYLAHLFSKHKIDVYGIDISEEGIKMAKARFGSLGIKFIVGDVRAIPLSIKFDCVFTRSCSLYNTKDFPVSKEFTASLLAYVRDGGSFIFAYNTKLSPFRKSQSWIYHTPSDIDEHFSGYRMVKTYIVNKIDMLLIRKFACNSLVKRVNIFLSMILGIGVEYICIVRK